MDHKGVTCVKGAVLKRAGRATSPCSRVGEKTERSRMSGQKHAERWPRPHTCWMGQQTWHLKCFKLDATPIYHNQVLRLKLCMITQWRHQKGLKRDWSGKNEIKDSINWNTSGRQSKRQIICCADCIMLYFQVNTIKNEIRRPRWQKSSVLQSAVTLQGTWNMTQSAALRLTHFDLELDFNWTLINTSETSSVMVHVFGFFRSVPCRFSTYVYQTHTENTGRMLENWEYNVKKWHQT